MWMTKFWNSKLILNHLVKFDPMVEWRRLDKINVHKVYNVHFFNGHGAPCLWFIAHYQAKEKWWNNKMPTYELSFLKVMAFPPSCNDDLCLLFQSKVLPWEHWVNVLPIHLQNLIVAHHSWVGKIPDSLQISLCHFNGNRQQLIQDCHAIGNVHHLLIPGNLRDEISWVLKIWSDGHPHTQGAHIVKLFQEFFNLSSI